MDPRAAICQSKLPVIPWTDPILDRLPGLAPVRLKDWIVQDEVFGRQMAYRDELLQRDRQTVFHMSEIGEPAAIELLELLKTELPERAGYQIAGNTMMRPDGAIVQLRSDEPLAIAGRLVQEDLLLMLPEGAEHRLVGGVLCFPAFWSLEQKIGRSLLGAHEPVDEFDSQMGTRVERLLHALPTEQAVMRANYLIYTDPELHQPALEGRVRSIHPGMPRYVRVERQTLRKLPKTRAVVFAIHTYVVPAGALDRASHDALARKRPEFASR